MVKKRKFNYLLLAVCLAVSYSVAFVGSLVTYSQVNSIWYKSIRPEITPPNFVFPIIWNLLFFMIGLSLFYALSSRKGNNKNKIVTLFSSNFALNVSWSYFYFGLKDIRLAMIDIVFLWFSILAMIVYLWNKERRSSLLLVPYLIWVAFAAVLNLLSIR